MEEEQKALNQTSGEEPALETTPVVEEQTAEETPVESTEPASPEETPVEETDQNSKKGANSRIRELVGEVKSLKQRLEESTRVDIPTPEYQPINLDSEVTPEQYRQHVLQTADALVDLKLKKSEALNRISLESSEVMNTYPQLNPDSESFDKELSETITEAIEAQVKLNPYSASVKKIAERLMKPYQKAVSNGVAQERETLARQVSESALKPTAIRKPEKTAAEKSIAELEAELGILQA